MTISVLPDLLIFPIKSLKTKDKLERATSSILSILVCDQFTSVS